MASDFWISISIKEARPNINGDLHNSLDEMIGVHGDWLPDNPKYNAIQYGRQNVEN